jgi:putative oxidoreductase
MNYVQRLEHWGDTHHPKWIDLLRIALGIFLLFKGIEFANNMTAVTNLVKNNAHFSDLMVILLVHYVLGAHLLGGALLTLGLLTRFACLIQIPILLGAIIFVNASLLKPFSELFLSILILALLVYFLIVGSGPWSLDSNMEKAEKK